MKQTILAVLEEGKPHHLELTNPSHFKRDIKLKDIGMVPQTKKYGVVINMKRQHAEAFSSDEEQMGSALVEDYFDGGDDAWEHAMVRSLHRTEQLGGALGPLFDFRMEPAGRRRRWRDTVDHTQFHARLEQGREARTGDDISVQLMEALYTTIRVSPRRRMNPWPKLGLHTSGELLQSPHQTQSPRRSCNRIIVLIVIMKVILKDL